MPPKAKFVKEEIIQAAMDIVREDGVQALTARALGSRLGSSARPIFTIFQSMDEVQKEVINASRELYKQYTKDCLGQPSAFMCIGKQYVQFASKEPKLFQLLFMTEKGNVPDLSGILPLLDDSYAEILLSIKKEYGIGDREAKRFYQHLWIYTHGIAILCATKMCILTEGEIEQMIYEVGESLLKKMWSDSQRE